MKAFVIAALAVVASAAPGNYAALRSAALPIGLGAFAQPAELKTIKIDEADVPVTAAHTYAAPGYGYGYGFAPAAYSVAPAEVKTIKIDEAKPVALGYAGYGYSGLPAYGYAAAPAAVAVKTVAPAELKTIKIDEAKPVALGYAGYGYSAPAYGYGYAAAPAAVAVKAVAPAEVKPVAYAAAPAAIAYAAAPTVVRQEVEIPVTKTVHYADEQVVTGHTTSILKPSLAAPAIAAPRTLVGKTVTAPATLSVQKYAAEVKTLNPVAQPYDVHYDVPEPYAVPTPVHTAPVQVRKRVYAPAAYAAPVYAQTAYAAAPHAVAVEAAPVEVKSW